MTVAYPRKLRNAMGAREILAQVVRDREIHLITLNRYRFSEQRSCKDLTDLIERLDGEPAELVRDPLPAHLGRSATRYVAHRLAGRLGPKCGHAAGSLLH
ncbi:hypothetical protein [Microcoleus vaginatus]|uniref:hypothetical protein n=1 Tax=Microcoleus vaginatus TaxID=119532 RepID=UPI00403F08E6